MTDQDAAEPGARAETPLYLIDNKKSRPKGWHGKIVNPG
jgi:hypothetical protein